MQELMELSDFAGLVLASHLSLRVTDLTQGGAVAYRVRQRINHVIRRFSRFFGHKNPAAELGPPLPVRQPGGLSGLDDGADAPRLARRPGAVHVPRRVRAASKWILARQAQLRSGLKVRKLAVVVDGSDGQS